MTSSRPTSQRFVCIELRAPDAASAERAVAEALEAGASGLEERAEQGGVTFLLYAPAGRAAAVRAALDEAGAGLSIGEPRPVPEADWSEAWKEGLEALEVSPRLRVRPSFVPAAPAPGQAELVIDAGQAFGTGGHASTLLALEWIAALAPELPANARVLDVGCGTGILALAALRLGAARGLALDIDPLAGEATRENAAANGLAGRLDIVVGPLSAVPPSTFDLVLVNLLESEMLPLLEGIAAHTAFGAPAILSGLLAEQVGRVTDAAAAAGLRRVDARERTDATGDTWVALLTRR